MSGCRTVIDILQTESDRLFVVVTPAHSEITHVITFDEKNGTPFYSGIPLVDIFPDHPFATKAIREKWIIKGTTKVLALVGVACDDDGFVYLLAITETEPTGFLPIDVVVHTVTGILCIPVNGGKKTNFAKFQLVGNHYFCENQDLTRRFGVPGDENREFVWNDQWRRPFEVLGLKNVCCSLIQGVCTSSHFINTPLTIAYVLRRSVLNPGTRYFSRGLGENGDPGNEVECELIITEGDKFWTNVWRRGSAPIRWRTELKTKMSGPAHKIEADTFRGTKEYFEKMKGMIGVDAVRVFSFLERSAKKSEYEISQAYEKILTDLQMPFEAFDINEELHGKGSRACKAIFEKLIGPHIEFNEGVLRPEIKFSKKQTTLNRFNCADSLDRVNLGTFYYTMIMMEKLKGYSQDVVDFLALSFVNSGNVVSTLSTNTPAIKIEAIREFSPAIPQASSDTNISLQRRFQNVANDPDRNRIIYLWARPWPMPRKVVFVSDYLAIFGAFPGELFGTTPCIASIGGNREVMVVLPRDCILRSVSLTYCNADSFTVVGDNEEVLGTHQLPETDQPCTYAFAGHTFSRCITIRFFSEAAELFCGNIAIEGEVWVERGTVTDLETTLDADQDFMTSLRAFGETKQTLKDVLILEKMRLLLRVSEENEVKACTKCNISPPNVIAEARILDAQTNGCAFCGDINEIVIRGKFAQSNVIPSLVRVYEDGKLGCCDKCMDMVENIALLSDSLVAQFDRLMVPPPFETRVLFRATDDGHDIVSSPSVATFVNPRHRPLLMSTPASVDIPSDTQMELRFVKTAVVTEIRICTASGDVDIDFGINLFSAPRVANGCHIFESQQPPIGRSLDFKVLRGVNISQIKVYGVFVDQDESILQPAKPKQYPPIEPKDGEWYSRERTARYSFDRERTIKGLLIKIDEYGAQNLLFCFRRKSEVVGVEYITLPRTTTRVQLAFRTNVPNCNAVDVYYCDKLKKIKPHRIGFRCA